MRMNGADADALDYTTIPYRYGSPKKEQGAYRIIQTYHGYRSNRLDHLPYLTACVVNLGIN
jgi:cephalosporin-C deacetylase-like acetyl esterase